MFYLSSHKCSATCVTDVFFTSNTPSGSSPWTLSSSLPMEAGTTPVRAEWHSIFMNAHYWPDKKRPKPPLGWWDHPWGQIQRGRRPPPTPQRWSVDAAPTCIFKQQIFITHSAYQLSRSFMMTGTWSSSKPKHIQKQLSVSPLQLWCIIVQQTKLFRRTSEDSFWCRLTEMHVFMKHSGAKRVLYSRSVSFFTPFLLCKHFEAGGGTKKVRVTGNQINKGRDKKNQKRLVTKRVEHRRQPIQMFLTLLRAEAVVGCD